MQFDFRQINASILEQWFGIDPTDTSNALLGEFNTLPIIGKQEPIVSGLNPGNPNSVATIYPNPLNGSTKIDFISDGKPIEISLMDMQGKKLEQIHSGKTNVGKQTIFWNSSYLRPGRYLVVFRNESIQYSKSVVKY